MGGFVVKLGKGWKMEGFGYGSNNGESSQATAHLEGKMKMERKVMNE